jgi:hypothetical protein
LYALYNAHPDYSYSVLVRTKEKAKLVTDAFPKVRIFIGGLEDSDILKEQASKVDILIRITHLLYLHIALVLTMYQTQQMHPTILMLPKLLHVV